MTWKRAMLGGFIVAGIYVGTFIAMILPVMFAVDLYQKHAIAAVLFLISWAIYFLMTGYIFSAYKLLDMRWVSSCVRSFLERKK